MKVSDTLLKEKRPDWSRGVLSIAVGYDKTTDNLILASQKNYCKRFFGDVMNYSILLLFLLILLLLVHNITYKIRLSLTNSTILLFLVNYLFRLNNPNFIIFDQMERMGNV